MPFGVYCRPKDVGFCITAALLTATGDRCLRVEKTGKDEIDLADDVAETLLAMGAQELIAAG